MSGEIKFRAWDKERKQMERCVEVNPFYISDCDRRRWDYDQVELMQFTTLPDKTGADIYEGDILRYYSDARMYVPIGDGKWGFKGNPRLEERTVVAWSDELGAYMVHGSMFLYQINEKSEVIGNMFENPELLEGWQ